MSYTNPNQISFRDGPAIDAFGRLRVSQPDALFSASNEYDTGTVLYWDTLVAGTGAISHLPNESAVQLSTGGTGSGASVAYQTRPYLRYQPGKSQQITITSLFGTPTANVRRRVGYFDASNGIFLEQTAAGMSAVQRSFTSGAAVDTAVAQASWNLDKLDGTGPSGITVDWTKTQVFHLDLQWLGVGRVRLALNIDGRVIYFHQFLNANVLTVPYMTTANLPIRAEITNTAAAAGTNTFKIICCSVDAEGGFELGLSIPMAAIRPDSINCAVAGTAVFAIRPKTTFGGKTNRGIFIPRTFQILEGSGDAYWICYYGDTALVTGGSWVSVSADSIVEMNVTPTGFTASTIRAALGYASGGGANARDINSHLSEHRIPGCVGGNGTTQYGFFIVGYAFSGTVAMAVGINWDEHR